MFTSLQSKIVCLIISIMVITAVILISISNNEIGNAMMDQQNRLSQHVLSLIDLNIKGAYNNLITDKIEAVTRHKTLLRARTDLVFQMIARQDDFIRKRAISGDSARQLVLDWVMQQETADNMGAVFITDTHLNIISHPDTDLMDLQIGGFVDMKRKSIAEVMDSARYGADTVVDVVNWEDRDGSVSKVLVCMRKYEPWGWILGTMVNIEAIEVEARKTLEKIIESLNETFKEITIARTGFPFIFDNSLKVLALSDPELETDFQFSTNTKTGNLLFQDMVMSAVKGDGFLAYESDLFKSREMIAYVSFFKPLGWYIGVTVPVDEIKQPAKAIASKQSTLIGIILFISILFTAWLVSRISKPINILASRVKEFSSTDLTAQEDEDVYIESLAEKYRDEVGRLADAFVFMKKQLKDNIRKLIETTAENERIEGELNVATAIQLGLLPKIFPPFPERGDVDLYASLEPAKEVGGDLYDFYFVGEQKLCFTIGDVSGKGVPAALLMAITKTLIKTSASKHESPADIMIEVNDAIASDNPQSMFVTLFIGILDLKTGKVVYSNGGHNPPVRVSSARGCEYVTPKSGPVVGIMDEIPYMELELDLEPGEALFLYTDGVTEAQNPEKEFYSEETLLEKITELRPASAEETVLTIKSDLKTFADVEPQFDDIAMLMIEYRGSK